MSKLFGRFLKKVFTIAMLTYTFLGYFPVQAKMLSVVITGKLEIDIWYGLEQTFGPNGIQQRWVNVLGTVSPADQLKSLSYRLNGGNSEALSWGPDKRRLWEAGDFNVELALGDLAEGINLLEITAVDLQGGSTSVEVKVNFQPETAYLPYAVDWAFSDLLENGVAVVDGQWVITEMGVRTDPEHLGYDRVLAFGDRSWSDYEVVLPFIFWGVQDTDLDKRISGSPGFGIDLRWQGHTNNPVSCAQPRCGWLPEGTAMRHIYELEILRFLAGHPGESQLEAPLVLHIGQPYWLRARVQTVYRGSLYGLKIWQGGLEDEPETWTLEKYARNPNLQRGSFLIVAHHVDVEIGDIYVEGSTAMTYGEILRAIQDLVARMPLLVVWSVAFIYLARRSGLEKMQKRRFLIALGVLFFESLARGWLEPRLLPELQIAGVEPKRMVLIVFAVDLVGYAVQAAAWVLMLRQFLFGKKVEE